MLHAHSRQPVLSKVATLLVALSVSCGRPGASDEGGDSETTGLDPAEEWLLLCEQVSASYSVCDNTNVEGFAEACLEDFEEVYAHSAECGDMWTALFECAAHKGCEALYENACDHLIPPVSSGCPGS